jgi:hypothetical protein
MMTLALYYGIFPLLGIYGLYTSIVALTTQPNVPWAAGVAGGSVVFCMLPLWFRYNLRRCYKRTRISDENSNITLDEQNIQAELPGYSKSTVEWKAVRGYREGKKVILVYITQSQFFVIPKRVLQPGQRDQLIALLQSNISIKPS